MAVISEDSGSITISFHGNVMIKQDIVDTYLWIIFIILYTALQVYLRGTKGRVRMQQSKLY